MSILQTIKTIIRVVLYLRLSDEDKNKLSKEELSQSIKNQEIMLRDYAIGQGLKLLVFIMMMIGLDQTLQGLILTE